MKPAESKKILIVHKNKDLRGFIAQSLEKYGFKPFQAESGSFLIDNFDSINPSFIIAGQTLPDMSGPELMKNLQLKNINIPFLVIADKDSAENALEMMKLGAVDYIFKDNTAPLFTPELIEKHFKNTVFCTKKDGFRLSEKKEDNYKGVFEDNLLVKMFIDPYSGIIVNANRSAAEFYGWSRKDLRGMNINEIDLFFKKNITAGKNLKNFAFESVHKKADGSLADVDVISNTLKIEERNLLYYIVLDSTEKKKKDNKLNLLSISLDHSPVLIVITDSSGNIEYVNHEFTKVTGYSFDEVKSKNPRILKSGKHNKEFYKELWNTVCQGRTWVGEFCNKKKNNEIYWEKAIISPVKNHRKQITNFVAIKEDITEKRNIVNELIIAKNEAQAANKAKSEFLATMSHELRTPLNGVIGFSEILKDTPLENDQKEYVSTIASSAKLLLNIINDILDFSKLEAGRLELEKVKTNIRELLYQSIDNIKFSAEEKGLEILLCIDPKMPEFFYIDPVRLKQILSNLLGNAVKFTNKGEVELTVSFRKISDFNGSFKFSIRDTGTGIKAEHKDKIFNAFTQADSSTTRKFGGTGLGLVISDMLAKEMKTEIMFESEPGKGSVFYFTIEAETKGSVHYPVYSDKKKALVIDDNKSFQKNLKKIFGQMNIEIFSCINKNDFSKLTEGYKKNFDIFIVDYESAFMPFEEIIKKIKEKFGSSSWIVASHFAINSSKINEMRVDSRIIKPLTFEALFQSLSVKFTDTELYSHEENLPRNENTLQNLTDSEFFYKVLIAEDNNLNMLLAKAIVSRILPSALILEAENGKKALDAYFNHEPDIIFMDVQMPIMDGNEAVSIIREEEKKLGKHTPVIGLTAVAFEDQLEISRKKGMDDFIVKPIEIDKFKYILQRFLKTAEQNDCLFDDYVHFNYHELFTIINDFDSVNEIIEIVKEDVPKKIKLIQKKIDENNFSDLPEILCSLKQTCFDMKFKRLADLCAEAENTAKDFRVREINKLFGEILDEWKVILCLLERVPFNSFF